MYDLIIKNGIVIDGTNSPRKVSDIAISNGIIKETGKIDSQAKRVVDAEGYIVTPGWVDIHTHYDGQATWDPYLTPSSWHGVTTSVFGNCGVGFAPVRKGTENFLINLMEGVEDIPESVLSEGIDFTWESFPEYLNALDASKRIMDIGTQVPHSALRFFVMGEDGADYEKKPNQKQIELMTEILEESLLAGALGVSTSRTTKHKSADGKLTPSLQADDKELKGIAEGLRRAKRGLLQCNSDMGPGEMELLIEASKLSGQPLSVLLIQYNDFPDRWKKTLSHIVDANKIGVNATGQVGSRPIGVLMGFNTSVNPFSSHSIWNKIKDLNNFDRNKLIKENEDIKNKLINEIPVNNHTNWIENTFSLSYLLQEPLNYEPTKEMSINALAKSNEISPWEIMLNHFISSDKDEFVMHTFENYTHNSLDVISEMLESQYTICGVGDAGAHVATICDASYPTFMVPFWSRDRNRGRKFELEYLVSKQTLKTAQTYGLNDRGAIIKDMRADINIIDYDKITVTKPIISYDLPAGGKRLTQKAIGYKHTFVNGIEVSNNGEFTGNMPGKLIRGPQSIN